MEEVVYGGRQLNVTGTQAHVKGSEARKMVSSAWSVEKTSTDYRAGNLYLTCKHSLATCTYVPWSSAPGEVCTHSQAG